MLPSLSSFPMNTPLIIFFHCLFRIDREHLPNSRPIVHEQMTALKSSGLEDAANEIYIGINGDRSSAVHAAGLLPKKAMVTYHGVESRNENMTIVLIEEWLKRYSKEAYVLYFHAKGSTHPANDPLRTPWRKCMMRHTVHNWRLCVSALDSGVEATGCHWMTPPSTPPGHFIFGGNFWWAKASFLRTLPSIYERDRIKESGIKAYESRYESEVWIGNGQRPPAVKDFHPNWNPSLISTCIA